MRRKSVVSIIIIAIVLFTSVIPTNSYAASESKYWLKVNTKANVVTVYKKSNGEWKPYRAMLCSTGINGTPTGTYYIKGRWDWGALFGGVYGRYCVHIFGDYLFHSVPYDKKYDKKSMKTKEFNKLGQDASKGCVRLSIMDARWVYNKCKRGTKVTIYKSSDPGPLGKPEGIKVNTSRKRYWDPTDPDPKNPYYLLKKPVISVSSSKNLKVQYGSSYNLKSGVTAKDPNTFQNLTSLVTVYRVKRYSKSKDEYVETNFSTKRTGTYKVTYRVKYAYGGTTYKTIKIRVGYKLNKPTVQVVSNEPDGKPKLTWKSIKNADKYVVYRSTSKNGSYSKLCTTKEKSYIDNNVESGTTYYYKVKAISDNSIYFDSNYSTVVNMLYEEICEDEVVEDEIIEEETKEEIKEDDSIESSFDFISLLTF